MNAQVIRELALLPQLTTDQLVQRYAELYGEQVRTRHRGYLLRKVAWRIQANAEGDLSERARRRAAELANDADVRVMPPRTHATTAPAATTVQRPVEGDPRLPPAGTVLTRHYKGRNLQVIVQVGGFEFEGTVYKTLTAVAKTITGTHVNGFHFFRLGAPR